MAELVAERIGVGYGGRPVLEALDLAIPPGRLTILAGPNGSGKSTLLKALGGLIRPASGRVLLDGAPLQATRPRALARRIGLLPQSPQAPEGTTVADLVRQGRFPHRGLLSRWTAADEAACASALAATRLEPLAPRRLEALSGGQRQRAWIAMVLAQQSPILLLDEPTTFLDLAHQVEVLALLAELVRAGRTVVAVLHDLTQAARYGDHLVLLEAGRIAAAGPPAEVLTAERVRAVFGVEVTLVPVPGRAWPLCLQG